MAYPLRKKLSNTEMMENKEKKTAKRPLNIYQTPVGTNKTGKFTQVLTVVINDCCNVIINN